MSRLYIPACGDRITLIKPWHFTLYLEHRNLVFAELAGHVDRKSLSWRDTYGRNVKKTSHTLEKGTMLECDRVYIRATSKTANSIEDNFDSISWKVVINGKPAKGQRFWAKLSDCCNLEFDPDSISKYQDRK